MKNGLLGCIAMILISATVHSEIHHTFCESKLWSHGIEILNVATSIGMIYFPIKSILKYEKNRNYLPEEVLISVSIGSALYHYHNNFITALFDEIGMLLFVVILGHIAFTNKFIKITNIALCTSAIILKLAGMSSVHFSYVFAVYAIYIGVCGMFYKIISFDLVFKLLAVALIRQITEDYCLHVPIFFSLLGHPIWHIFIAKYAVETADQINRHRSSIKIDKYIV
jgi:hypothetical protein